MKEKLKSQKGAISAVMVMIIVVAIIFVVIIAANLINRDKEPQEIQEPQAQQNQQQTPTGNTVQQTQDETRPTVEGNENVKEENGLKTNTSSKLQETKKYGNYTFSNIRLQTDSNGSVLLADVTTSATEKQVGKTVTIKFLDKDGKEVAKIGAYIGQIKPGETVTFRTETTTDVTNAYDFVIE